MSLYFTTLKTTPTQTHHNGTKNHDSLSEDEQAAVYGHDDVATGVRVVHIGEQDDWPLSSLRRATHVEQEGRIPRMRIVATTQVA